MEFLFDCESLFKPDQSDGVVVLDAVRDRPIGRVTAKVQQIYDIIDKMGAASAKAQKLGAAITTAQKFFFSEDNKLYLIVQGKTCLGLLKIGKKNLFIRNDSGQMKEIKPLCVLDFYVHESVQRNGIGKIITQKLFEKMLSVEKIQPHKLGYDRPSEKLLSFLSRHYCLKNYVPQTNNFVVFSQYFDANLKPQVTQRQEQAYPAAKQTNRNHLGGGGEAANFNKTQTKEDMIRNVVEKFCGQIYNGLDIDSDSKQSHRRNDEAEEEEKFSSSSSQDWRKSNKVDIGVKAQRKESESTCSDSSSEDNKYNWPSGQQAQSRQKMSYYHQNQSSGVSSLLGGGSQFNSQGSSSKAFEYNQRRRY